MVASWARAEMERRTRRAARRIEKCKLLRLTAGLKLPANLGERKFIWSLRIVSRLD
jgi:hypothetical protein